MELVTPTSQEDDVRIFFCQQCGVKLEPDSIFCESCGTKIE